MDKKLNLLPVVLIVLILLLFVFYLGVLSPARLTPAGAGGGTMAAAARYHSYNPLAENGFLALVIGAIIFFWALGDLGEKVRAIIPKALALAGVILLFMSLFNLVMGLHDLLTFTVYERATQPSFGQQYGWLIQFFVYAILGIIFLYAAEHFRKEAGEKKSLVYTATMPLGIFMLVSAFVIFTTGFHSFLYNPAAEYRQSLSWIIETFIYGVIAYALLWFSEKLRKKEGILKSVFSIPVSYMGMILLLITLGAYLFGTMDYVYAEYAGKNLNWLTESIVFGVLGIGFVILGDKLYRADGEESDIFQNSMFISGGVLLTVSILIFIMGFNDFLYSSAPTTKWLVEFFLLLIPGAVAVALGEFTERKNKPAAPPEKMKKKAKEEGEE